MGQIRVAVYDTNAAYTERFCKYMGDVPGRTEVFCPVYEKRQLDAMIAERAVEAVLVPEALKEEYPSFIGDIHVGYFTEEPMEEPGELFRYQARRELFRDLEAVLAQEDTAVKMVVFTGAESNVGCSAAASAYAAKLASGEKRVLYINMNSLGDDTCIYQGGNPRDLGFLLTELKNGGDMGAAMASVLNRDTSGVYFYDNAAAPMSLMDVKEEEMTGFFNRLKESGEFQYLVVESSFSLNYGLLAACQCADRVVLLSDGTAACNYRLHKIWEILENRNRELCGKSVLLYNKFHKQYGRYYEGQTPVCVGCIESFPPSGALQLVDQLTELPIWKELLR